MGAMLQMLLLHGGIAASEGLMASIDELATRRSALNL